MAVRDADLVGAFYVVDGMVSDEPGFFGLRANFRQRDEEDFGCGLFVSGSFGDDDAVQEWSETQQVDFCVLGFRSPVGEQTRFDAVRP